MPDFTTTTLWYRKGTSDKIYQPVLEKWQGAWRLSGLFGRRNYNLRSNIKGVGMSWEAGLAAYQCLVMEKISGGYVVDDTAAPRAEPAETEDVIIVPVASPVAVAPAIQIIPAVQAQPAPLPRNHFPGMLGGVSNWFGPGGSLPLMLPVQPVRLVVGKKGAALARDAELTLVFPKGNGRLCYVGYSDGVTAAWNLEGKPMALHQAVASWLSLVLARLGLSPCVILCYMDDNVRLLELVSAIVLDGRECIVAPSGIIFLLMKRMVSPNNPTDGWSMTLARIGYTPLLRRQLVNRAHSDDSFDKTLIAMRGVNPEVEMQSWFEGLGWLQASVNGKRALVVLGDKGEEIILSEDMPWNTEGAHAVRFLSSISLARTPYCENLEVTNKVGWARRSDCTMTRFLDTSGAGRLKT